jgi:hypothetical protein
MGTGCSARERRCSVGRCTTGLGSGDFNGDGRRDLAVTDRCSGDVAIFLGDGAGGFTLRRRMPFGLAGVVAVADFDGDGRLDLVVGAAAGGGGAFGTLPGAAPTLRQRGGATTRQRSLAAQDVAAVSLFFGNGDGTFVDSGRIGDGGPVALLPVDLDGDDAVDLVDLNGESVGVRLGRGDGSFVDTAYPAGTFGPAAVVATDVDGDGVIDLVVAGSEASNVAVLLGRGDGSFAPSQLYAADGCPAALTTGDVDGNGSVDLLVASACSSELSLLLHN